MDACPHARADAGTGPYPLPSLHVRAHEHTYTWALPPLPPLSLRPCCVCFRYETYCDEMRLLLHCSMGAQARKALQSRPAE